ncbi:fumarylacetoacetate hydrolase family protein [Rhodobacteraceae bacterium]|nr:fumarylacetoacetate hydrolase family protein [Paracoccaceae bacterium]
MKLVSFSKNGEEGFGIFSQSGIYPVLEKFKKEFPNLRAVIDSQKIEDFETFCESNPIQLPEVSILPPIPNPGKIICAGMNYRKPYPVDGVAAPDPGNVVIFARHTETLVGHGADLELPSGKASETYDFEGEIVAVIGKSGRFISKDDALNHVIGYSIMNEGSVRGWMKHSVHAGKNFHASGSWGPWITTVDEIDDFSSLRLETHINGKLMQSALAGEMIFSLSELIAYISNLLPLNPGDIIATGSPDGTGGSRNPTAFLNSGDCVEVSVDRIGTLKNHVGP